MASSETPMIDVSFQLKGSTLSVVVLALLDYQPQALVEELKDKIDQAPQFFVNSPVLISLEKLDNPPASPLRGQLNQLLDQCRELGFQPLGFTAVPAELEAEVRATGLALITRPGERELKVPEVPRPAAKIQAAEVRVEERLVQRQSRVVNRPVRSGQQAYAEGADLILLTQVSEGAEVLADGNIHVYGALRGRALAGVRGDESARIFCQSLEAELVSIAGNFLLQDGFPPELLKKPVQIFLDGESLRIELLNN